MNTLLCGIAFSTMTFTVATVLLDPSLGGVLLGVSFAALIGLLGGLAPGLARRRISASSTRSGTRDGRAAPDELRENLNALRIERDGAPARPRRRLALGR